MGHPDAGSFVSRRYLRELRALWFFVGVTVGTGIMLSAFWLGAAR